MTPDGTVVNVAGTLQLVGLGVILILVIIGGAKIASKGGMGFASAIIDIVGILIGLAMVARPVDMLNMLLKFTGGGVQTPALPH